MRDVAQWLAYEELPFPRFLLPIAIELDREQTIDFVLVANLLNFAYTDFETGVRFDQVVDGVVYADSDALLYCLHRAIVEGIDVLDGAYLAQVTTDDLRHILRGGTTELQMLDERAAILRDAGAVLVDRYDGHFYNLVAARVTGACTTAGTACSSCSSATSRASTTSPNTAVTPCASTSSPSSRSGFSRSRSPAASGSPTSTG